MTRGVRIAVALALAAPLLVVPLRAEEGSGDPYELVRSLRALQDRIARGSTAAHANLRPFLAHMAAQLAAVEPSKWQEARNARAAVTFVLSGGDPGVLRRLLDGNSSLAIDDKLIKGVLAYGEGRGNEAAELLAAIDARKLESGIAGHVALVQGELAARKDPARAIAHLEEARLLATGTLVEEAALRREISLLALTGAGGRWEARSTQYLRRFPASVYAASFRRQFALDTVTRGEGEDGVRPANLEALLANATVADRRDIYLSIAEEAIVRGKVAMTRFAAAGAGRLAEKGSADSARSGVYEAAALVVTEELERGLTLLDGVEKGALGTYDAELREAALSVAAAVRQPIEAAEGAGGPPAGDGGARHVSATATAAVLERARKVMAEVDELLKGSSR